MVDLQVGLEVNKSMLLASTGFFTCMIDLIYELPYPRCSNLHCIIVSYIYG